MRFALFLAATLLLSGCSGTDQADSQTKQEPDGKAAASSQPADSSRQVTTLTPANTQIQFVGVHTDKSKDDRVGSFQDFEGQVAVDESTKEPVELSVEIKTDSITTEFPKLTTHLKSPDFFDAPAHPTAAFRSQSIAADGEAGQYTVSGELTMMDTTKELSFPATINVNESGIELSAEFQFNRIEWGMKKMDGVEDIVTLRVSVSDQQSSAAPETSDTKSGGQG